MENKNYITYNEHYYRHKTTEYTIDLADLLLNPFINKKEIANFYLKIKTMRNNIIEGKKIKDEKARIELCFRCDQMLVLIGRILKRVDQIEKNTKLNKKQTKEINDSEEKTKKYIT